MLQIDQVKPNMTRKRPRRDGILRARVAAEIEEKVGAIADARGADKSDIVREAVMRFVEKFEEAMP